MLLSDIDIRAAINTGAAGLEPFDPSMVQLASIDIRLASQFRTFESHKHACIDPSRDQADLTRLVKVGEGDPFVLHPGEFVLAATLERVTLGPTLARQPGTDGLPRRRDVGGSWDGRGMSPQKSQPESVDYTGSVLSVDQAVTFIETSQDHGREPRLYSGVIKVIGREQLVVESGGRLFIVAGREDSQTNDVTFRSVLGLPAGANEV